MAIQTQSSFSTNAQTYIAAQTLKRVHRDTIVYGLGKKEKLPNRFSKTFQFTRYEKLPLPYSPLAEGVSPTDNAEIQINTVQAVMDQWGSFINLSDVAEITAKHPSLQKGIELLAEQASETIDRECIKMLMSNSRVGYPGTAASRVTLIATDYASTAAVKKQIASLRKNGAHAIKGRLFIGLLDPCVELDLVEDDVFETAASYSNIVALMNGEVGTWMGVRWMCSNLIPTMSHLTATVDASITTGGTLASSDDFFYKVVAVSKQTGFEVASTEQITQATGTDDVAITITMPADTENTYNIYIGDVTGVLYLQSEGNAAAAVITVGALPGSGRVPPAHTASGVEAHYMWILGLEAFAVPELMSLQTFLTPAAASDSDPLAQRRKASWKVMFKPVICNELFIERLECTSRY